MNQTRQTRETTAGFFRFSIFLESVMKIQSKQRNTSSSTTNHTTIIVHDVLSGFMNQYGNHPVTYRPRRMLRT